MTHKSFNYFISTRMKMCNMIVVNSRIFHICKKIWLLLNGGLLSDIILCGGPCSENIFSSTEILQLADLDDTIWTTDSVNIGVNIV